MGYDLRLIVTILMREEKDSVLLKRLASYNKQHKLYAALKEFGKIPKTSYILRIVNDVTNASVYREADE